MGVAEVAREDIGGGEEEDAMQCANHPSKNSTPGGICAFCLQEKLGKLVSSSFPAIVLPASSSSSSPSFRSDAVNNGGVSASSGRQKNHVVVGGGGSSLMNAGNGGGADCSNGFCSARRSSRLPFILTHGRKKTKKSDATATASDSAGVLLKRSKSTATPRRGMLYLSEKYGEDYYSPHRRAGFWSFLYLSTKQQSAVRRSDKNSKDSNFTPTTTPRTAKAAAAAVGVNKSSSKGEELAVVDENGSRSPTNQATTFDRKVSRSRSVGCGSRSFSGDFFERISTGFGDCTLRRVESQREGKHRGVQSSLHRNNGRVAGNNNGSERVRCGGIFSGFMITSSSSSSSSAEDGVNAMNANNNKSTPSHSTVRTNLSHGRSRSWGWAIASPMRAFSKSSYSGKRQASSGKNVAPNLAAIPSILA